jgi:hypothetical protein
MVRYQIRIKVAGEIFSIRNVRNDNRTFAIARKVLSTRAIVSGFGLNIIFCDDLLAFATSPKSPNSYNHQEKQQINLCLQFHSN